MSKLAAPAGLVKVMCVFGFEVPRHGRVCRSAEGVCITFSPKPQAPVGA